MSLSAGTGPSRPPTGALDRARGLLACLGAYLAAGAVAAAVGRLALGLQPILTAALADLAATLVVFVFSLAYNNSSFYDPYWSLIPPFLALFWLLTAGAGGLPARQLLAGGLLLAWAARLTFNWVRRWRGLSHEDWRYADYRRTGAAYWPLSFVGFHLMPTVIVFLGCLSLWPALTAGRAFGALDAAAALFTAGAVVVEGAADRQLARFLRTASPEAVLSKGLWSLSARWPSGGVCGCSAWPPLPPGGGPWPGPCA
jgi:steroid 5-alpha reductase family enzyme